MHEQFVGQTEEEFQNYLKNFGIPVEIWGRGDAKAVSHLMREVVDGETVLIPEDRELLRQIRCVAVNVIYRDGKYVYKLVEDRQEFSDGRVRKRKTESSISEKIRPGEKAKKAAERAIREELGITGQVNLSGGKESKEIRESPSYPGLKTQYLRYNFNVKLNQDQFSPDGYVEKQDDKTTYFVWKKR